MRPASRPLFARSNPPVSRAAYFLPVVAALAACGAQGPRATDSLPPDASAQTVQLAQLKDMLDGIEPTVDVTANALRPAPLIGRGFAQVAAQPGQTLNQRRLLAMRAARMEALRDLTEQVHGLRLRSDSLLRDAVLRDDTVAAQVQGTLRGARTTAIEPRGEDGYVVTLELDTDTVAYVLRALGERP